MSKYNFITITILALSLLGCQKYSTYPERDFNAVKNGTNPLSIPSSNEYENDSHTRP